MSPIKQQQPDTTSNAPTPLHSATAPSLGECVEHSLQHYFAMLEGDAPSDLHPLVMGQVESSLLALCMKKAGDNQTRAAAMLGINRGTLRKKLKQHQL